MTKEAKTVDVYIAHDGKEFNSALDCLEYERQLSFTPVFIVCDYYTYSPRCAFSSRKLAEEFVNRYNSPSYGIDYYCNSRKDVIMEFKLDIT